MCLDAYVYVRVFCVLMCDVCLGDYVCVIACLCVGIGVSVGSLFRGSISLLENLKI